MGQNTSLLVMAMDCVIKINDSEINKTDFSTIYSQVCYAVNKYPP